MGLKLEDVAADRRPLGFRRTFVGLKRSPSLPHPRPRSPFQTNLCGFEASIVSPSASIPEWFQTNLCGFEATTSRRLRRSRRSFRRTFVGLKLVVLLLVFGLHQFQTNLCGFEAPTETRTSARSRCFRRTFVGLKPRDAAPRGAALRRFQTNLCGFEADSTSSCNRISRVSDEPLWV